MDIKAIITLKKGQSIDLLQEFNNGLKTLNHIQNLLRNGSSR